MHSPVPAAPHRPRPTRGRAPTSARGSLRPWLSCALDDLRPYCGTPSVVTIRTVERRICAGTTIPLPLDALRERLVAEPAVIFSGDPQPLGLLDNQVTATLELQVGTTAQQRHEIVLTYGPAMGSDAHIASSIQWTARRHPELFPRFEGTFGMQSDKDSTELELVGVCDVPLGGYGDGQAGRRVASQAVEAQLRGIAERLTSERRRAASAPTDGDRHEAKQD